MLILRNFDSIVPYVTFDVMSNSARGSSSAKRKLKFRMQITEVFRYRRSLLTARLFH